MTVFFLSSAARGEGNGPPNGAGGGGGGEEESGRDAAVRLEGIPLICYNYAPFNRINGGKRGRRGKEEGMEESRWEGCLWVEGNAQKW